MSASNPPSFFLIPRNAAQHELVSQLMTLHRELQELDEAGERLYAELGQQPDEPRSAVVARTFRQSATSPFSKHERHRRALQNQFWKLVKLFYQLAKFEDDADIGTTETEPPADSEDPQPGQELAAAQPATEAPADAQPAEAIVCSREDAKEPSEFAEPPIPQPAAADCPSVIAYTSMGYVAALQMVLAYRWLVLWCGVLALSRQLRRRAPT